ncbi:protein PIF-like [Pecten maximus]|uniref:protein PIF-like n=1 Tax=Pecten maximus TaxID=6579 RepID=UPI0014588A40|nr:protein PIF-like [Pecten maximus]
MFPRDFVDDGFTTVDHGCTMFPRDLVDDGFTTVDHGCTMSSRDLVDDGLPRTMDCALKLDLVFIIDGTSAVPPHDFSKLKQAVLALLRCMHERDQVHAGVIVYGSTLARPIPLSGDRNKLVELEGVNPPMGQPETHIALLNGRALFRKRGRPQVKKVAVFLTSGLGKFAQETIQQAEHARKEGYRLIVVTLASEVEGADQLPWRPGDIFKLKNVNEMVEELGKIARKICSVAHADVVKPLVNQNRTSSFTRQPSNGHEALGDIAEALRGKTDGDASDMCSQSILIEGVGYARHPKECDKLVQCFLKESGAWYYVVQSCGVGEFWDQELLACRLAEVVDCPNDRCKDPSVTSVPHSDNCKAYYHCEKGHSVGQCCPGGSTFDSERGCVNHTACPQECVPETSPKPGFCDRAAVFARPEVYSQYISTGSYWVEMPCANGSWYNDRKCRCTEEIVKPWGTDSNSRTSMCKPEVYLPFCGGLTDHSGHGNVIENEGDRVFVIDGKAYFNGHSTLYLPSFSNAHYGDSVVIKLKYKMAKRKLDHGDSDEYSDFDYYNPDDDSYDFNDEYDEDEDNRLYNTMALVSNGDCDNDYTWSGSCYENPTITIATNRRTTIFNVYTSEDEQETQMEVHKKLRKKEHDELDVDYYDDEYYSYLFENGFHDDSSNCTNDTWDDEWRTVMFLVHNNSFSVYDNSLHDQSRVSGYVRTTSAGLQFGQGSGFRNFKGYMDEIYVYLCRPNDSDLFDEADTTGSDSTVTEVNMDETTRYTPSDVTKHLSSPSTSIGTTQAETSGDVLDYSSESSLMTESTVTEYDEVYLTRIITEALDSEFSTTMGTIDLSEVTSLSESTTSVRESFTAESLTTVSDSETTLKNSSSSFNSTSSSSSPIESTSLPVTESSSPIESTPLPVTESSSPIESTPLPVTESSSLIERTSSHVTETSSNPLSTSSSVFFDSSQPVIEDTEKITETSSISSPTNSSHSNYQTTFEPGVKEYITESELPQTDIYFKNRYNVTSVSGILEESDSYNTSSQHNRTTPLGGDVDSLIIPTSSLRGIVLNNNSFLSLLTGKNTYLKSTTAVASIQLGNDTLRLHNNSENNGNCCIDSQIHGATKGHNHTAQSILKTNGAIIHNENGEYIDKERRRAKNNSLTTAIQSTDDTTAGAATSQGSYVTQSVNFSKWLFAKFDSDYHSENRRSHDSEANVTGWRPEH